MKIKWQYWIALGLGAAIIAAIIVYMGQRGEGAQWANSYLDAGHIELGMPREAVEQKLDEKPDERSAENGMTYDYKKSGLQVVYDRGTKGNVRYISLENDRYSAFGLHVGDKLRYPRLLAIRYGLSLVRNGDSHVRLDGNGIVLIIVSDHERIRSIHLEIKEGRLSDDASY